MSNRPLSIAILAGFLALFTAFTAEAADTPVYHLSIKNHAFIPAELTIPAGQKVKLLVKNEDPTPSEFESTDLNREIVVSANSEIPVYIDALDAGTYSFFDDFHRDTTNGKLIAK